VLFVTVNAGNVAAMTLALRFDGETLLLVTFAAILGL
jgi:hypothetical protein